jgi:predicted transcriptional regulator
LQREVENLKLRKGELAEDNYYQKLQQLLVELSDVEEQIQSLEEDAQ